ncbi:MAG: hypothetical protein ACQJCO_04600 [cyanobacterium endosymbiont of Rhopalodia sterrenbergii]
MFDPKSVIIILDYVYSNQLSESPTVQRQSHLLDAEGINNAID